MPLLWQVVPSIAIHMILIDFPSDISKATMPIEMTEIHYLHSDSWI